MARQRNKHSKQQLHSYEYDIPPRSDKYKLQSIAQEQNITIGNNKYLMRNLSNGAIELVRYDIDTNKWAILCFDKNSKQNVAV